MLPYTLAQDENKLCFKVHNLLNQHLQHTGKMFRPQLTQVLGKLLKVPDETLYRISWASELIHNASLIHDDVVDNALTRREKPTLNAQLPNSKAVLAGDYLLASVIAELVRQGEFSILKTLAETLEEIVEGEFEQDSLRSKAVITAEDIEAVARKKTGALIAWNCHSVAVQAGLSMESQLLCKDIGLTLGLAFQLIDDNLDYSRSSGKEYGKDLKEGLINFTTLNLIQIYPELYYSIYQVRGTNFTAPPWSEGQITEAIKLTSQRAGQLFDEVFNLLQQLIIREKIPVQSEEYMNLLSFLKEAQERQK